MSDFPDKENYNKKLSELFTSRLKSFGIENKIPLIIRKEKDQYLYDIDMNKYTDFFLNNGSVIVGHNNKVLTKYIKNAISIGTESVFINKFYHKLVRLFSKLTDIKNIQFYQSVFFALYNILNDDVKSVGVTSVFLYDLLKSNFFDLKIVYPLKNEEVDLLIFEPIDFDNSLEVVDFKIFKAKKYCSFEGRTFFRLKRGFYHSLDEVDYILAGNIIANGMDAAIVISKEKIKGNIIPTFLTVAIHETIKYYLRKRIEFPVVNGKFIKAQKGGILKLNSKINLEVGLRNGIFVVNDVAFLSILHTVYDLRRLERAFSKN
ncbi:MAG: hypothetical protein N2258_02815 [Brevinematales bacterium]|nr:hypothetical protein [Brevinematales bacterium]